MTSQPGAVGSLLGQYQPDRPGSARYPPWAWSNATGHQLAALERLVTDWVHHYNEQYATAERHVVPLCWPEHPWLSHELAAMAFLWYSAHRDPTATAERAGEFYLRYLPGFQHRLPEMLGSSPIECQRGQHPQSWRREVDTVVGAADWRKTESAQVEPDRWALIARIHDAIFGFPHSAPTL